MKKISPVFLVLFIVAIIAIIVLSVLYFQQKQRQQAIAPEQKTGVIGATKMLGGDIITGTIEGIGKSFSNLTSIFAK